MKYEVVSFFIFISLLAICWGSTSQGLAQEGRDQGLVRCSAGNLVRSSTECPSTDLCPPSEKVGTVVHCSLREATKPSSFNQSNTKESDAIAIFTNKPTYKFGEIVNITIKN